MLACVLGTFTDPDSVATPTIGLLLCMFFLWIFIKWAPYR